MLTSVAGIQVRRDEERQREAVGVDVFVHRPGQQVDPAVNRQPRRVHTRTHAIQLQQLRRLLGHRQLDQGPTHRGVERHQRIFHCIL